MAAILKLTPMAMRSMPVSSGSAPLHCSTPPIDHRANWRFCSCPLAVVATSRRAPPTLQP